MPSSPPPRSRTAAKPRKPLSPRGRGSVAPSRADGALLKLFAANVRRVRLLTGLTQAEMADAADIDPTYASGVEQARRNLGINNIQRIADALRVDARVLFDPDLERHPTWGGEIPAARAGRGAAKTAQKR